MRAVSLKYVPTAILSRQVAVIRKQALIINLPGQPKAIKETLDGIFAAVPYCIDLIGGPYMETNEALVKAFRPKSAQGNRGQTTKTGTETAQPASPLSGLSPTPQRKPPGA
jgi:hypothetical protein